MPRESPPGDDTDPPETPPDRGPRTPRKPSAGTRPQSGSRRGASYGASWRIWWELNREHMLGLRGTIESKEVVSGGAAPALRDDDSRAKVQAALRRAADRATDTGVRAAALRALGRAGDGTDARRFLRILRTRQQPKELHESAAIGLGCLPRIDDPAIRAEIRSYLDDLLAARVPLHSNSRRLAILALSLRGREDPILAMKLAAYAGRANGSGERAALLYACGLTRDPRVQSMLIAGVRGKKVGKRKLDDLARSRAALGLAMSRDRTAIRLLARVLSSRSAGVHTRRSAAIGLGLLLRAGDDKERGADALRRALERDRDPLVKGYAAVAMGTAREPVGIRNLRKALDDSDRVVRPYAALALGLAAPRAPQTTKIQDLLLTELRRSKDPEKTAALSIAVGISGAAEAREHLFACLKRKRLQVAVRAPAIQALGLLRKPSPEIEETLALALEDASETVAEDASLALGFLGQRNTARMLVRKLVETKSESVQIHMVAALSHLGSRAAIDPLIEVLRGTHRKDTMRESAAAALGILADDRRSDPLFEIDAHTNPYGLTVAGRALVMVY
ncbi:MAG: HEAT repeat domain-containing protein [Planctomycetota bacterium]